MIILDFDYTKTKEYNILNMWYLFYLLNLEESDYKDGVLFGIKKSMEVLLGEK